MPEVRAAAGVRAEFDVGLVDRDRIPADVYLPRRAVCPPGADMSANVGATPGIFTFNGFAGDLDHPTRGDTAAVHGRRCSRSCLVFTGGRPVRQNGDDSLDRKPADQAGW